MHIILLSGGSGKRLWPLSNDIRSKQFIKLFREENKYESMVQRVYRQIKTVNKSIQITIATSKTQASAIYNQLGEDVAICVEPTRRDTFPAIALAAAYLHDEKGVDKDETIVICPVDPYVEDSYFETINTLENVVSSYNGNLTLMGIEPTYPSEKYGYIIPETNEKLSAVIEFKEKPNIEKAKLYLAQGALWNAGVFACKLGYIMEIAHSIMDFKDYRDLYAHYSECPKISFDYAVVEKEKRIQVVRYSGEWRDVGTWNMMSEVMSETTKGNVVLDDTCRNVNVVNELDIPILVMGAKDTIVVASHDGILISDKERSGYIKPYAEKISTDIRYADKSWGNYQVIDVGDHYLSVKITMAEGQRMSYHSHAFREEIWTILSGKGEVIVDGSSASVSAGDVVTLSMNCKHTILAKTKMVILETQIGEVISKDDKYKYFYE